MPKVTMIVPSNYEPRQSHQKVLKFKKAEDFQHLRQCEL